MSIASFERLKSARDREHAAELACARAESELIQARRESREASRLHFFTVNPPIDGVVKLSGSSKLPNGHRGSEG